ncbi:ATP-binding cassette domain-containing protein [Microbacterium sp. A84]|uniref:ATP-binding cassette domain-containing protein n=1 Tax=Microbacterium sp. A84 TaxID=3450715 RepID=UPI003F41B88A
MPHPLIRASVPWTTTAIAVVLAWMQAASLAVVFIATGAAVDASGKEGLGPAIITATVGVVLAAVTSGLSGLLTVRAQSDAEAVLRQGVTDVLFDGGVRAAPQSGAMLALATGAVERTARYRAAFLGPTLGAFTTPLLILGIIALTLDPFIAAVLAVLVVLVPLLIGIAQRAAGNAGAESRRQRGELAAQFLQSIQGLGTLVAAGAAERAERDLAAQGERHRRALMRVLAANQILILVMDAAVSLGVVLMAALLSLVRVGNGTLTAGQGLAIVLCTLLVIRPVDLVGQFFYIGIGGRASQRAIGAHLARERERAVRTQTDGSVAETASIVLRNVTAGWTPDRPVLRDLSFRVEEGERVVLVGPSGIGKSTVSALIQAHLTPDSGRVEVAGAVTTETSSVGIRRSLAVVEQRTHLFHGTIADNLRLADASIDEDRMWKALEGAGLAAEVRAMPAGLASIVGEHGLALSGGQSQRLAIARAFIRDAPILLLDEPTSQVDLAGEAAFLDRLDGLAAGRTVLMIAHRPAAMIAADRVIDLSSSEDH